MYISLLLLNVLFEVVTKIIQCMFLYKCPCMYSTINISGCIILSSDICGFFFCKVMIVVVACVVIKSPDALVEVVIFLDFDFMYAYLFPALECTV